MQSMTPLIRSVYLAGPISGLTHDQARYGWREEFARMLPAHVVPYSPMRDKEHLTDIGVIQSHEGSYPDNVFSRAAGIVTRDVHDVSHCDVMVACFLESDGRASLGTAIEFGLAHAWRKPIVMIATKGELHERHAMLQRMAGYHVETLAEGAAIVKSLLTPGV